MRCCQKRLMIPGILFIGLVLADPAAARRSYPGYGRKGLNLATRSRHRKSNAAE